MAVQKNTADLLAQAASTLPNNTTQQISPQDVREMAENTAVSNYNKITDKPLVGLKEFSTIVAYESGQGTVSGGKIYISNKVTGPGAFVTADWDLYDSLSAADKAKLDFITVTGAANLDQLVSDVAALDRARVNKGTFQPSLGVFPGGGTAQDGWTWIASDSGTIDGVEINGNDAIMAIVDNASTSTFVGNWYLEDNSDKVVSVNAKVGAVVIDKTDVGLGNVPNVDATDRANHTGTQLAATISDFDTEVANNTAVAANTAKVSFPEAPIDGTQYARKDGAWEAVAAGAVFSDIIYVDSEVGDNGSGVVGDSGKPFETPEGVIGGVTVDGTITGNTSTSVTISNISDIHNADLKVGQWLKGSGIQHGTIIVAKGNEGGGANTITLNKATTSTVVGVSITWVNNYLVKCSGTFTLTGVTEPNGNLFKDGLSFDFGSSQVIINNWTPFYHYPVLGNRATPLFILGGYWFGKGGNSYLIGGDPSVAQNYELVVDIKRFESPTTFHGILMGGSGVAKFGKGIFRCPYFYVPFGYISTTECVTSTEIDFAYAYGALGGCTYRYGTTTIKGNINTPSAINAIQQVSNQGNLNLDGYIVGSASLSECRVKGLISGTSVTVAGAFFSNNSINAHIIANVTVTGSANGGACEFLGFIKGNLTNTGGRVSVSRMYGNYVGNGASYGKIIMSQQELAGNSITLNDSSELILENVDTVAGGSIGIFINDTSKLFNEGYHRGGIGSLEGTIYNTGVMILLNRSAAIIGMFINRSGRIELENPLAENSTNTPTIDVSTGSLICDGGEIICNNASSLSGLIRKSADGGKVILKGGAYLKAANGLAPLQILSNVGTAQDIMVFDAITNSAVGFGLLDTFSDTTYGTTYAPNDIAGGQLLQNTNFDF